MPRVRLLFAVLLVVAVSSAATLQQLSLDQMSQSATSVVRARIVGTSATSNGSAIYTHYKLAVTEIWKGAAGQEFVLPGGEINGRRQSFPGVPELRVGAEYVLFLWKAPSTGITHVVGLTQGLFDIGAQGDGSLAASRRESGELMLDAGGKRVSDQPMSLKLAEMKARVRQAANSGTSR